MTDEPPGEKEIEERASEQELSGASPKRLEAGKQQEGETEGKIFPVAEVEKRSTEEEKSNNHNFASIFLAKIQKFYNKSKSAQIEEEEKIKKQNRKRQSDEASADDHDDSNSESSSNASSISSSGSSYTKVVSDVQYLPSMICLQYVINQAKNIQKNYFFNDEVFIGKTWGKLMGSIGDLNLDAPPGESYVEQYVLFVLWLGITSPRAVGKVQAKHPNIFLLLIKVLDRQQFRQHGRLQYFILCCIQQLLGNEAVSQRVTEPVDSGSQFQLLPIMSGSIVDHLITLALVLMDSYIEQSDNYIVDEVIYSILLNWFGKQREALAETERTDDLLHLQAALQHREERSAAARDPPHVPLHPEDDHHQRPAELPHWRLLRPQ